MDFKEKVSLSLDVLNKIRHCMNKGVIPAVNIIEDYVKGNIDDVSEAARIAESLPCPSEATCAVFNAAKGDAHAVLWLSTRAYADEEYNRVFNGAIESQKIRNEYLAGNTQFANQMTKDLVRRAKVARSEAAVAFKQENGEKISAMPYSGNIIFEY